ncbi:hypothetical protein N6H13_29815 [Paenibacillus sp. CC-CFT742]|nr:hypothetical protein [Paenibacillus sp. CC-CFT742]WJH29039.1 hypothetical protein N6H13_29815 [Paenibacillus sp. CC-CFT742]
MSGYDGTATFEREMIYALVSLAGKQHMRAFFYNVVVDLFKQKPGIVQVSL